MYPQRGNANAYKSAAIHSGVDLPPQKKLALLLGGALDRLRMAESQMERGQLAEKLVSVNQVLTILEALRASLDHDNGGAIADQLSSIYTTAEARLVEANARNDVEKLRMVIRLLMPIDEAFRALAAPPSDPSAGEPGAAETNTRA